MFIAIPTGTDAPIYHWPRATVALIVVNIAAFCFVPPRTSADRSSEEENAPAMATLYEQFSLSLGDGLHPVQWVTHNFLHIGIGHLVGNMIFLWAFGIVVEGKLGTFKYLAVYLSIGFLHGALVQTVMLRSTEIEHAVGASAVIFGLLAICMIWAPRNELNCLVVFVLIFRVFVYHWDLYYTTVALCYLAEQLLGMMLGGLTGRIALSELGHLSGAFWGFVIGTLMLRAGWVDCEGWDIYSVFKKNRGLAKEWKKRGEMLDRQKKVKPKHAKIVATEASEDATIQDRSAAAVRKVQKLIAMGDFAGAVAAYDKNARILPSWPTEAELQSLIKEMHTQKAEAESIPLMRDYSRRFPESASRLRIKYAQILIRDRQRPTQAVRVLNEIPAGSLPEKYELMRRQLVAKANAMIEDGVLELEEDL